MKGVALLLSYLEHAAKSDINHVRFHVGKYTGNSPAVIKKLRKLGYVVEAHRKGGFVVYDKPKQLEQELEVQDEIISTKPEEPQENVVQSTVMKYKWINVETGGSGVSEFTGAQHGVFADPDNFGKRTQLDTAKQLIEKWNKQQPNHWAYELVIGE